MPVQVQDARVEITLPDGTCVRVGADVGLASLRRIMAAVRA
jgi:transposase